jgi:malate permease and related proteins
MAEQSAARATSHAMIDIFNAVLPIFGIMVTGAVLRRLNWLTLEADQTLMRMLVNVFMPCLIFDSILGNPALENWKNLSIAPAVGLVTTILGYLLGKAFAPLFGLKSQVERRTFSLTAGTYNYGYIPLPLAIFLFDRETVGVLFLHNMGVDVAIWTAGLAFLTGSSFTKGWKSALNPPVLTIVFTVILHFTRIPMPEFLLIGTKMLGQCSVPIGLLLVGATVFDYTSTIRFFEQKRVIVGACLLRLGILPILFLLLAKVLPCSVELKRVIMLQAAMPAATFPILITKHYGGDVGTALRVALGTSAVSIVTIPVWMHFGTKYLF